MKPKTQMITGIIFIILALGVVWLQIATHVDLYSLLVILLCVLGGQQIGQSRARNKK